MTLDQLVNMIMKRLGNRQDLKSAIEYELEYAREFGIERGSVRPWYLLTNTPATVATVANQAYVAVPTDFLGEYEYGFLAYTDSVGERSFLVKKLYDELTQAYDTGTTGRPTFYAMVKDRIYLYPTPDAVYNLGAMYYQSTGRLDAAPSTNAHLLYAADWLMGEAGVSLAVINRNELAAELFGKDLKTGKSRILHETEERQYRNAWSTP